jgi:flagellar motor component MotA
MKTLENKIENSKDKMAAESSENSPKSESAPGFTIVSAVAGIILLAFGSDLGRGSRRNP